MKRKQDNTERRTKRKNTIGHERKKKSQKKENGDFEGEGRKHWEEYRGEVNTQA